MGTQFVPSQPLENFEMKKRILPLLLLGSTIAGTIGILTACGDSEESLTGPAMAAPAAGARVEFSKVQPILNQKCMSCHKDDNYNDSATIAQGSGSFLAAVQSGAMPAPGAAALSSGRKATLVAWLQSLAPAAAPPTAVVNASGRVEFSSVLAITREKCATCHGSYTDSAKLSGSAAAVQHAVEIGYMPDASVGALTPVQKITLLTWLKQEQGL